MEVAEHATLAYEEPLLSVPLGALGRQVRQDSKRLEKEWAVVHKALDTLIQREEKGAGQGPEQLAAALGKVGTKLKGVKRKFEDAAAAHSQAAEVCAARARYIADAPARPSSLGQNPDAAAERCDRLVADCLLRWGMVHSAAALAEASGTTELCDIELYTPARQVVDGLRRGSCAEALAWCAENRMRLRRSGSDLEFQLRVQEAVSMPPLAALAHAKEHLAPHAADAACMTLIRALAAASVLSPAGAEDTAAARRYGWLRDPARWSQLGQQFQRDFVALTGCPEQPLLLLLLQAGLLALNTSRSDRDGSHPADPMNNGVLKELAEGLPQMTRKNSALVCSISGEVMDDGNPPVVTPQGHVYSAEALRRSAHSGGETFTCPRTVETVAFANLRKAYIM
eukprot:TRINITY_DN47933_c0_g1_i1.p1 TRINITY_DN47933_c0_g1~~TRINITY_DN47933_c0_g1_i1.p1  ORF type:complete len:421 (+),score=149.87 TRINITY_DN47933_c0_g1_i1:75-1265(+)